MLLIRRTTPVLALAGLALLSACGGSSSSGGGGSGPIRIGMAVGLSGYLASVDKPVVEGAEIAVGRINASGGVLGRQLELKVQDMASDPAKGVTVTNQLINSDKAGVLLNGFTSAATAAETPVATRAKVPIIAASILPADPSWVFSTIPPNRYTAQTALGYAKKSGARTVGILFSQTPFGEQAAKTLATEAGAQGLQVVGSETADAAATNLTPQVSKLAGADVIVDAVTGPAQVVLAQNAKTLGYKGSLLLNIDSTGVFQRASEAYPKTLFVAAPPQVYPQVADAQVKSANDAFVPAYKQKNADNSGVAYAGRGYDAVYIAAEAMKASGATTGDKLLKALEGVKYDGTSAVYAFSPDDHNGYKANPYVLARFVQPGKIEVAYAPGG